MAHPRKKIYREFSPGYQREQAGTTLSRLKKLIASDARPTQARAALRKQGLLGG